MAPGNDRQKILLNQTDQAMIWGAPDLRQRYPLSLDSDVLMSNRFHLLFEVRSPSRRFSGPERLVKKIFSKEKNSLPSSRRTPLKDLIKNMAAKSRDYPPGKYLLRKGRLANVVEARDQFICEAVLEQGYLASQVADFLVCHPSNVSGALQKS